MYSRHLKRFKLKLNGEEKMPARDTGASRNVGVNLYIKNLAARNKWLIIVYDISQLLYTIIISF